MCIRQRNPNGVYLVDKNHSTRSAVETGVKDLRVELIPIIDSSFAASARLERVARLLAEMILSTHSKGRPKKDEGRNVAA